MKITMKAALLAATLTALSAQAQAAPTPNTVFTSVNARAGLSPLTEVDCSDVDFGVWRVPMRTAGGLTTITLSMSGATTVATATGNTTNVAVSAKYLAPTAGVCNIIGAFNLNQSDNVSMLNNRNMPMVASAGPQGLPIPGAVAAMFVDLYTAASSTTISNTGAGLFYVVGELRIPETIVAANYGGYVTADPAKVIVDDIIPG